MCVYLYHKYIVCYIYINTCIHTYINTHIYTFIHAHIRTERILTFGVAVGGKKKNASPTAAKLYAQAWNARVACLLADAATHVALGN